MRIRRAHGREDRGRRRRRWWIGALVPVVAVGASVGTGAAALARPLPAPSFERLVARNVMVPGAAVHLRWPAGGQAAMVTTGGISFGGVRATAVVPVASVAKVMTALVVLADHPLVGEAAGPALTISAADVADETARAAQGQSVLVVTAGEALSERQALDALLVPSANNIASVLARFDAGTEAAFVAKMNITASRLGMNHTHYSDPSGFDPATTSTVADQLLLARAALAVPVLGAIVAQPAVTLPGVGSVINYDTLAGHFGYQGIKTGSTPAAGGCLLFAVTRAVAGHPVTIIGAVFGQRGGPYIAAAIKATQNIVDQAFAALKPRIVLPAGTPILAVRRAGRRVNAITTAALSTLALPGSPLAVSVGRGSDPLPPGPMATVSLSGAPSGAAVAPRSAAAVAPSLPAPSLRWRVGHLVSRWGAEL